MDDQKKTNNNDEYDIDPDEKKMNDIIDSIQIIYDYKENFHDERILYDEKNNQIISGVFPVINDIYIGFLNTNLNIDDLSSIIISNIYEKNILNFNENLNDLYRCVAQMDIILNTDSTINIKLSEIKGSGKWKFRKEKINDIKTQIFRLVNEKCKYKYNIINLTFENVAKFKGHAGNLILEKNENGKIYVYLFDPNGNIINDKSYDFYFVNIFLTELFKNDNRFIFSNNFLYCDKSIHSFSPKEYTAGGKCALFNFFWYYCVLSYCIKYNESFTDNISDIHDLIIQRFEKDTDDMINRMCNLIIIIFLPKNIEIKEKYIGLNIDDIIRYKFSLENEIQIMDKKMYIQKKDFYIEKKKENVKNINLQTEEDIDDFINQLGDRPIETEEDIDDFINQLGDQPKLKKQKIFSEIETPIFSKNIEIYNEYYSKIIKTIQYVIDNFDLFKKYHNNIDLSDLETSLQFYYLEYLIEKL